MRRRLTILPILQRHLHPRHASDTPMRKPVYGEKSRPEQNETETQEGVNGVIFPIWNEPLGAGCEMPGRRMNRYRIAHSPSFFWRFQAGLAPFVRLRRREAGVFLRRFTFEK